MAGRKISGGKYHKQCKKQKHALPGHVRIVKLGEKKTKILRGMGGTLKTVSLSQKKLLLHLIVQEKFETRVVLAQRKHADEYPKGLFSGNDEVADSQEKYSRLVYFF